MHDGLENIAAKAEGLVSLMLLKAPVSQCFQLLTHLHTRHFSLLWLFRRFV
ncbi:hypothetical protein SynBIOSU31_01075 [Synechococcus sp. BIOS-U3-1]|nr:hypothetical protein SynBIOSU31_01075 [Synechococcus sp. BIOS-U3-1]